MEMEEKILHRSIIALLEMAQQQHDKNSVSTHGPPSGMAKPARSEAASNKTTNESVQLGRLDEEPNIE